MFVFLSDLFLQSAPPLPSVWTVDSVDTTLKLIFMGEVNWASHLTCRGHTVMCLVRCWYYKTFYVVFFDDKGIKIYLCNSRKTHLEKIFTFLLLDISPLGFRSRAAVGGDVADVASGPLQISQVIFTPLSLCRSLATHAYATLDPCAGEPLVPSPILYLHYLLTQWTCEEEYLIMSPLTPSEDLWWGYEDFICI